jgi:hypothetical protein
MVIYVSEISWLESVFDPKCRVIFPVEHCTPSTPFPLHTAFQGGFPQRFFPENYVVGHPTALYIS